jgi:hypothetical protein
MDTGSAVRGSTDNSVRRDAALDPINQRQENIMRGYVRHVYSWAVLAEHECAWPAYTMSHSRNQEQAVKRVQGRHREHPGDGIVVPLGVSGRDKLKCDFVSERWTDSC